MTENPQSTHEFNIGQLVTHAYKLAGLVNFSQALDETRAQFGRDELEGILKHLEAQGLQVRVLNFVEVLLDPGSERYTLDTNVLDVIGDGAYIPADQVDTDHAIGETQIRVISMDKWQKLSSKGAEGRPVMMYPHRASAQVEIRLWPIPQEAGTVRLQCQLLYPNATNANYTPGLERPWYQYLKYQLAHELALANSKPLEKVAYLKGHAEELLRDCKGFSNQRASVQFQLDHASRWR